MSRRDDVILCLRRNGKLSPNAIAEIGRMPLGTVKPILGKLKAEGLADCEHVGPRETLWSLTAAALETDDTPYSSWLDPYKATP